MGLGNAKAILCYGEVIYIEWKNLSTLLRVVFRVSDYSRLKMYV